MNNDHRLFKPEDFIEAVCIGKMSEILERIAESANQIFYKQTSTIQQDQANAKLIEFADQLRPVICKLKAMGHFFETQDPQFAKPSEMDHINSGIALILDDIGERLSEIADLSESIDNS